MLGKVSTRRTWLHTLACSVGLMCGVSGWGQGQGWGLTFLHSCPWVASDLHVQLASFHLLDFRMASYLHPITVSSSFLPLTISVSFLPQPKSLVTWQTSRQVKPSEPRVGGKEAPNMVAVPPGNLTSIPLPVKVDNNVILWTSKVSHEA